MEMPSETVNNSLYIDNPVIYRDNYDFTEKKLNFNNSFIKGNLSDIYFDDVRVFFSNNPAESKRVVKAYINSPTISMYFLLKGESKSKTLDGKISSPYLSNQHNLIFNSSFEGEFLLESKTLQNSVIQFSEKFFSKLTNQSSGPLKEFFNKVKKGDEFAQIAPQNLYIIPEMRGVILDILNCNRTGYFKKLFLEAKIIELFLLQVEQSDALNRKNYCNISKSDKEKLYEAKNYLEENLFERFSLLDVSKKVGLNDYKLKKGFKELFGTTVFGYLNDFRMEYAKHLIMGGNKTVSEVSDILDYSAPHHFSNAFKKKFGYLPGMLK